MNAMTRNTINKFEENDTVYIITNNRDVTPMKVIRYAAGFYTLAYTNRSGGMRLRETKVYATAEEAKAAVRKINRKIEW